MNVCALPAMHLCCLGKDAVYGTVFMELLEGFFSYFYLPACLLFLIALGVVIVCSSQFVSVTKASDTALHTISSFAPVHV